MISKIHLTWHLPFCGWWFIYLKLSILIFSFIIGLRGVEAQVCWLLCRDLVGGSHAGQRPWPGGPSSRGWRWSTLFSFPPLPIQGRHSCEGDFTKGEMCLQKSYNNERWDFIPWEEASPALYCPLCIYWSSLLFLHSLIPCKCLDVCDYFRCLIVIENLR